MRTRTPASGALYLGGTAAMLLFAAALASWARGNSGAPLRFNHSAHVQAKIDCTTCHLGVMDPAEDRLPNISVCTGCHKDPAGANPVKQELARLAASGAELHWPRTTIKQPDHVFFSHPRHVDVAKLDCKECHAEMLAATEPPRHGGPMSMYRCEGCHAKHPESVGATRAKIDCLECHR
jgi:hypothetical protein